MTVVDFIFSASGLISAQRSAGFNSDLTSSFGKTILHSPGFFWKDNFIKVLDNLPFNIRKCVKYRIKNEHGWYLAKRLKNFHSYIGIEDTNKDLFENLKTLEPDLTSIERALKATELRKYITEYDLF